MAEDNRYPITEAEGYSNLYNYFAIPAAQMWEGAKSTAGGIGGLWRANTGAFEPTLYQDAPSGGSYMAAPKLDDTRYRWTMPMPPVPQDEVAPIQMPTPTPKSGRMVAQSGTPFYTNINPETGVNDPNRIWASNTETGALTQMPLGEEDVSQFVGGQRIFGSPNTPGGRGLTPEEWANVTKVLPTGRYIGDEGKDIPEQGESRKTPQSYQDRVNRINEITNEVITWARKSPLNQKYAESELEFRLREENLHNIKEPKPIDLSELNRIMDSFKEPVIDHSNPLNPKVTGYRMNWAKYNVFAKQYGLPSLQDRDEVLREKERRMGVGKEKPKTDVKGKATATGKVR